VAVRPTTRRRGAYGIPDRRDALRFALVEKGLLIRLGSNDGGSFFGSVSCFGCALGFGLFRFGLLGLILLDRLGDQVAFRLWGLESALFPPPASEASAVACRSYRQFLSCDLARRVIDRFGARRRFQLAASQSRDVWRIFEPAVSWETACPK